jgi:cytochrome c-type biogenesis protein
VLEGVFVFFSKLFFGGSGLALAGAFVWGILSVLLSPCHLASLPLIMAFVTNEKEVTYRRAFLASLLFSLGILFSITLIGVLTGLAGRMLGDIGVAGVILVAGVFLVIGLNFLGVFELRLPSFQRLSAVRASGKGTAFLLGFFLGLGLGPCTFAFLAPVLGLVFSSAAGDFLFACLLVILFAAGHSLVFVFFGGFAARLEAVLRWNESRKAVIMKKALGVIMIFVAFYLVISNVRR